MFITLGIKNILTHKINPNLKTTNLYPSNQLFRNIYTHSKTLFNANINQNKLTPHEHSCSSKILSNGEFDLKVRNIVQEELKRINLDTEPNHNDKTKINDVDFENKIKNIVSIEIDKIKESIKNNNQTIQSDQTVQPNHNNINKSKINKSEINNTTDLSILLIILTLYSAACAGMTLLLISIFGPMVGILISFFIIIFIL